MVENTRQRGGGVLAPRASYNFFEFSENMKNIKEEVGGLGPFGLFFCLSKIHFFFFSIEFT
jgi:hypothetical protein